MVVDWRQQIVDGTPSLNSGEAKTYLAVTDGTHSDFGPHETSLDCRHVDVSADYASILQTSLLRLSQQPELHLPVAQPQCLLKAGNTQ